MKFKHHFLVFESSIRGKIGWDPSASESNRSHVDNFWFSFIDAMNILYNSSKRIGKFSKIMNLN